MTTVAPKGKIAGALFVTEATEQLSFVTGTPKATPLAVHNPASELTTTSIGQAIVGDSVSLIVTLNEQEVVFPAPSTT